MLLFSVIQGAESMWTGNSRWTTCKYAYISSSVFTKSWQEDIVLWGIFRYYSLSVIVNICLLPAVRLDLIPDRALKIILCLLRLNFYITLPTFVFPRRYVCWYHHYLPNILSAFESWLWEGVSRTLHYFLIEIWGQNTLWQRSFTAKVF